MGILIFVIGAAAGFYVAAYAFPSLLRFLFQHFRWMCRFAKKKPKEELLKANKLEDKVWHEQETDFAFRLHEQLSCDISSTEIARHVAEQVNGFLFLEATVMLVFDKDNELFRIGHAIGLDQNTADSFSLKKQESIAGYVIQDGQPLVVNDLTKEYFLLGLNKEPYLKKSFAAVPLMFRDEVLGVLYACNKRTGNLFTNKDASLLFHVGKVASIALKNVLLNEQIKSDYLRTITTLAAAIDARDHYTECHSENVAKYAMAIAEVLHYPLMGREQLRRAALLHDIGKIGIKDELLLKADRLTNEEYEQFKRHPEMGEHIVRSLTFLKEVSVLIRHHHERYDGKGYPDGLSQDKIELGARILAVADSFDAMVSDRLYRKALPLATAIGELEKNKGAQFDPAIADCFISIINRQPELLAHSKE